MAVQSLAITNAGSNLFTSVNNNAVTTIMVCNIVPFDPLDPTADLNYLYLYVVNNNDPVSDNLNLVVNKLPVPAGETVTFDSEKIILANGDRIFVKSVHINSPSTTDENLVATISTLSI